MTDLIRSGEVGGTVTCHLGGADHITGVKAARFLSARGRGSPHAGGGHHRDRAGAGRGHRLRQFLVFPAAARDRCSARIARPLGADRLERPAVWPARAGLVSQHAQFRQPAAPFSRRHAGAAAVRRQPARRLRRAQQAPLDDRAAGNGERDNLDRGVRLRHVGDLPAGRRRRAAGLVPGAWRRARPDRRDRGRRRCCAG